MGKRQKWLVYGVVIVAIVAMGCCGLALARYHRYDMTSALPTSSGGSAQEPASLALSLTSPSFEDGASIPSAFTCDGDAQLSPELRISGAPAAARSLAIIMDDPDIPDAVKSRLPPEAGGVYVHWVMFNIPATTSVLQEGASVGVLGANGSGAAAYVGPCPPTQYEPSEHRYVFTLYALDSELALSAGATRAQVLAAMKGHVIETVTLTGRYKRT